MILIFSKNRAMQLDALLRSMQKYYTLDDVNVLYVDDYGLYPQFYFKWKEVFFLQQHDFKEETEVLMAEPEQITFLCDDDIFYRNAIVPIHLKPFETFSLRLGKNVKKHRDYTISLDGNTFRTEDILPLMEAIEYKNPNQLEIRLVQYQDRFTMRWNRQCLVGIPHNKVSTTSNCWSTGKHSVEELNDLFRKGYRIGELDFENITDVHADIEYNMVRQSEI